MEYSYRFRIYPTKEQEAQIAKTLGCCRYVYNPYLAMRTEIYKDKKESMNYNACSKDMTELKKIFGLAERSRFYGFTICIEVFGYGVSELLSPLEEGRKTWISQIQKKTRLQTKRYQQMCGQEHSGS